MVEGGVRKWEKQLAAPHLIPRAALHPVSERLFPPLPASILLSHTQVKVGAHLPFSLFSQSEARPIIPLLPSQWILI